MKLKFANYAFTVLLFLPVCHALGSCCQESASEQDEKTEIPNTRQVGDDESAELKDPIEKTDEKKSEAMAAYMDGQALQKDGDLNGAQKAFQKAAELDPTAAAPVKAHAMLLMRLGRTSDAERKARTAIQLDPADFDTRLQLALLLRGRGKAKDAVDLIEDALKSDRLERKSSDAIRLHSVRGALFQEAQAPEKAVESYEALLDALENPKEYGLDFRQHEALTKDRLTGYEGIGRVMLRIGRYDKAIASFKALVEMKEDKPGIHHFLLASAQYRKDDLENAERNLDRYFESNERSANSLQLLGDIYRAKGKPSEVPTRLEELAEDSGDASKIRLFLGSFLVEQGDAEKAKEVFNQVIADTGDADAHLGLVRVDILSRDADSLKKSVSKALRARIQYPELVVLRPLITNDPEFAKSVVESAIKSADDSGNDPTALFFYGEIAQELELLAEEEQLLKATLDLNPAPRMMAECMNRLAFNYLLRNEFGKSAEAYRGLLAVRGLPENQQVVALWRLSQAELRNDNYSESVRAAEAALKMRPQNPELTYQLGWAQLLADQTVESERNLKAAMKLSDEDNELEIRSGMMLAALYSQERRWKDGIQIYEDLLKIPEVAPPIGRRIRTSLSNAYVQVGDLANGERILEEVYESSPDDIGVNNDLGYLYADQNKNLEQAEKMIRIAVAAEPDNRAYLDSLGWVLYRLEKYEEALEALNKANSDPEYRDSTIIEHLGDVYSAMGEKAKAKKTWEEALKTENDTTAPNEDVVGRIEGKLKPAADSSEK